MTKASDFSDIESRKLAFEERKWDEEMALRKSAPTKSGGAWADRISPLIVTIAAGILTLAGSVIAALLQGSNTLRLEQQKFDFNSQLEEKKEQHELILKMISVGNEDLATRNIKYLAETGLISDPVLAKKLLATTFTAVLPKPDGSVAEKISPDAINLMVQSEVTDQSLYEKRGAHPSVIGPTSGVTIGIGYDLGYVTADKFEGDWGDFLDANTMGRLKKAIGQKGDAAKALAVNLADITIPWEIAIAEFQNRSVPNYMLLVKNSLPNVDELPPMAYGALVSLVYLRGAAFDAQDDRHIEMRAVRQMMADKNFGAIPGEIRKMGRLYTGMPGITLRLEAIAAMFEKGISKN